MESTKLDFRNMPVGRLFVSIFFPTLVGMLFMSALNIFDGMFVGHGVGPLALAAINIVAPLFLICTGIGLMLGIGASVAGSIRLAHGNEREAGVIMTQAYVAGLVLFGVIIAVSLLFTDGVLDLFGCNDTLRDLATDYLLWLLPGLLFLYLQCVGMMLIRLDGSPKYAMTVQIVAALFNIVLDWLFVFPLGLGIGGAAQATSISCGIGGIMVLVYFLFFSQKLRFRHIGRGRQALRSLGRNVANMAKIGMATFIAELAIGLTMVTGNYMFLRYLGEDGVAAYSVGCYLFPLLFSINNAVAQSAQPIISFNYGIDSLARVRRALGISVVTAVICGSVTLAGMWIGAPQLASLFLEPSAPAYAYACQGLPLLALCTIFFAVNVTFIGYYQSIEQAMRSTLYTLFRGMIFIVPSFIILPALFGVPGLWLAIPVAEALTMAIIIWCYATGRKASAA